MKKDEAYFLLKNVFDVLIKEYPELKYGTYRDGGSVSFSTPQEGGYDNIILLAPVVNHNENGMSVYYIKCVQILKPGCVMFEDSYKIDNIMTIIMLDDNPQMNERNIKEAVRERLKSGL